MACHSGVWQVSEEASDIQTERNAMYRTIIGVKTGTCMRAVRHKVGVAMGTQLLRANIVSPMLRNYILFTPEKILTHGVYKAL